MGYRFSVTVEGKRVPADVEVEQDFMMGDDHSELELCVSATVSARDLAIAACGYTDEPEKVTREQLESCSSEGGTVVRLHDEDGGVVAVTSVDAAAAFPIEDRSFTLSFKTRLELRWSEEAAERMRRGFGSVMFHRMTRALAQKTLDSKKI